MKSKRSLAEILGVVLGVAAMALVVAALVYLLGARPFHRLRGPWFQTWGSGSGWGGSGAWASEEHTEEVSQRVQKLSVNNVSRPVHVEG